MSDYLCNDCLDTGWIEDREGKTVCACISETEPYQLLLAEVEALKATCKQHLQVQRYELVYDEMQEDDDGDWVRWIDIESAMRGEGE